MLLSIPIIWLMTRKSCSLMCEISSEALKSQPEIMAGSFVPEFGFIQFNKEVIVVEISVRTGKTENWAG